MKRGPLLHLCDTLWTLGSNDSRVWACAVLNYLCCCCFSGRDCPTVSKTSCCVANAFSFPSASHFPLTNFYPNLYTYSASLNSSSVFLWPSSASRHLLHPSYLAARLCLESCTINVPLHCLNLFQWNFFFFEFFLMLHCILLFLDSSCKFISCKHSGHLRIYRKIR